LTKETPGVGLEKLETEEFGKRRLKLERRPRMRSVGFAILFLCVIGLASNTAEFIPSVFIQSPVTSNSLYTADELGYERIIVTADEEWLHNRINQQRALEGADPLHWNNQLTSAARFHSQEMIDNNYFSHDSKDENGVSYETFEQRMHRFNYNFYPMGENIAGCQTPTQAFEGWLDSPGHHSNMVNKGFSESGLGIAVGGPYGKMFTHDFGYRPIQYDLEISSDDISYTQVGTKLIITALIHNPGSTHAYPVMVRFYEGAPSAGGQPLGPDVKVPAIIIGDDYRPDTATIEWDFLDELLSYEKEESEIFVKVDPEDDFGESNEDNNMASIVVSYEAVADGITAHPAAFGFCNCTPNPVIRFAQISYSVPEPMPVRLRVYDPTGRSVVSLIDKSHQSGIYQLTWDGKDNSGNPVGAGVYLLCLDNGRETHTRSLVVVR
jgi:uncharacterized protein YkwD